MIHKLWMSLLLLLILLPGRPTRAQSHEISQLLLNIEKLNQFRQILQQMYNGYKILSDGYNKVKDITSGNFELHELFLDGLYLVSPEVKKYHRIADILRYQAQLVKEYKAAYRRFAGSGAFTPEQLVYLAGVYQKLFGDSLHNLDELLMVITARQLRMSDDERIAAINRIYADVEKKLLFLRHFNRQQSLTAISKLKEQTELQSLRNLFGTD